LHSVKSRAVSLFSSPISWSLAVVLLLVLVSGPLILSLKWLQQFFVFYEWIDNLARVWNSLAAHWWNNSPPEELYTAWRGQERPLSWLSGVTANVFAFLGNLGIILILSLYWSADNIGSSACGSPDPC
jgi:hypothetical protein